MSLVSGTVAVIKTTAQTVTDVGRVLDYAPFPTGEIQDFVSTFTTTIGGALKVRALTIECVGRRTKPIALAYPSEVQEVELDWYLRYFTAVEDQGASESGFIDRLEAIVEALNSNRHLAGAPEIKDHDPADYTLPNNAALLSLGDTICHYGEVTFTSYHEHVIAVS